MKSDSDYAVADKDIRYLTAAEPSQERQRLLGKGAWRGSHDDVMSLRSPDSHQGCVRIAIQAIIYQPLTHNTNKDNNVKVKSSAVKVTE